MKPYMSSCVNDYKAKMRELWNSACEWERVPADSMFVEFSPLNPYMEKYNRIVMILQGMRNSVEVG